MLVPHPRINASANPCADVSAGANATLGLLTALHQRQRRSRNQVPPRPGYRRAGVITLAGPVPALMLWPQHCRV